MDRLIEELKRSEQNGDIKINASLRNSKFIDVTIRSCGLKGYNALKKYIDEKINELNSIIETIEKL